MVEKGAAIDDLSFNGNYLEGFSKQDTLISESSIRTESANLPPAIFTVKKSHFNSSLNGKENKLKICSLRKASSPKGEFVHIIKKPAQ